MYHSTSDLLQPTNLHERTHRDEVAHIHTHRHLRAQTLQVAGGGNGVL